MTKRQESHHSLRVDHATASQTNTWIDRELAGSEFRDVRLNKRFRKLFQQLSESTGESIPLVLPGLGKHKGGLSFSVQPPRHRRGYPCWTLSIHARAIRCHGCDCFGPSRYNGIYLSPEGYPLGGHPASISREETPERTAEALRGLRNSDAFQPGDDHRWTAPWPDGYEVLDAKQIHRLQRSKEENQSDTSAD
jgi:Transposase DNA-binding